MATPDPWLRRLPEEALPATARALIPGLREAVLSWHAVHGRHDLPWQVEDPYGVWVSEVMLQQTQVATGLVRYPSWMARFPTVQALAAAPLDEVLKAWEGLGYYARARNLHRAARQLVEAHGGRVPAERALRLALPGVGPSTASAIGAFGFGRREAILDGNVQRVWARWWADAAPEGPPSAQARFWWGWAQAVTPEDPGQVRAFTQAIMDLGATVCTPRKPACQDCPLRATCRAFASGQPEAWPRPSRRSPVKDWPIAWAWTVDDAHRLAVVQRPAGGPWEGLWTLPECPQPPDAEPLAAGRHALSHRRIAWAIHPCPRPSRALPLRWVDQEQFQALALPRPLRRWWQSLTPSRRARLFQEKP